MKSKLSIAGVIYGWGRKCRFDRRLDIRAIQVLMPRKY
jgi:hypothetical protein